MTQCHNCLMKNISLKIKKAINNLLSFFPSALPIGMTEFDKWSDSVIALTNLPNNLSMKWSLATMILHSDKACASAPKRFFARCLHKAAANEVAGGFMHEAKNRQKAEMEAAAAQEATVETTAVAHDSVE